VLGIMALIFVGVGAYLASLGGSLYYVIGGLLYLVAAVLLFRGRRLGAWVFGLTLAITVVWALFEVGFDGWALMPRLMIPVAFGIWLLLPWSQHALRGKLAFAGKVPAGATGLIVATAVVRWASALAFMPSRAQPARRSALPGRRRHLPRRQWRHACRPDRRRLAPFRWGDRKSTRL